MRRRRWLQPRCWTGPAGWPEPQSWGERSDSPAGLSSGRPPWLFALRSWWWRQHSTEKRADGERKNSVNFQLLLVRIPSLFIQACFNQEINYLPRFPLRNKKTGLLKRNLKHWFKQVFNKKSVFLEYSTVENKRPETAMNRVATNVCSTVFL